MRPAHTQDQPTESIVAHDPPVGRRAGRWAAPQRWRLPQRAMRTVAVVVSNVFGQYSPQLPTADEQHPVQGLPPYRADPSFGEGVRPGRLHRRAQHLDSFGGEDRVERGGELCVAIADQEPEL